MQSAEQATEEQIWRDREGLHWKPDLTRRWSLQAETRQQGLVLVHAHTGRGRVRLSPTDESTCARLLDHFALLADDQAHGYFVVGSDAAAGWFTFGENRLPLARLKTVICPFRTWGPDPEVEMRPPPGMARQVAAITTAGQARLAAACVGVVGLGGGGSDVADQLGHLGIGHLMLCDADVVKEVNLSRQRAAGPSNLGAFKVDVAAAAIRDANPSVTLTLFKERFPDVLSYVAFRSADLIVSCVDGPLARHEVNTFGRRFLVPIVDIGATIRREGERLQAIAGHAARLLPDGACLECEGLTSTALRDKERSGRDVPYFESDDVAGAPQVISVNGVLASLAVTEVMRLVAGLSDDSSSRHWRYEALRGEVYCWRHVWMRT